MTLPDKFPTTDAEIDAFIRGFKPTDEERAIYERVTRRIFGSREIRFEAALRQILDKGTTVLNRPNGKLDRIEFTEAAKVARAALLPHYPCGKCETDGRVANDEDESPWSAWATLPVQSAAAVTLGLVFPVPCPVCKGTGIRP